MLTVLIVTLDDRVDDLVFPEADQTGRLNKLTLLRCFLATTSLSRRDYIMLGPLHAVGGVLHRAYQGSGPVKVI